jgi:hypothetical protein
VAAKKALRGKQKERGTTKAAVYRYYFRHEKSMRWRTIERGLD